MEGKLERSGEDFLVRISTAEVLEHGFREGQTVEVKPQAPPRMTLAEMVAEARRLGPAYEPETIDWGPDRGSEIIDDDDPR